MCPLALFGIPSSQISVSILERQVLNCAPFYNKTKQAKAGNKTIDMKFFFFC